MWQIISGVCEMSTENIMDAFLFFITSLWMPISINIMIDKKLGVKRRIICAVIEMTAYLCIMIVNCTEISAIVYFPICLLVVYFGMGRSKLQLLYVLISYMLVVVCDYSMGSILMALGSTDRYENIKVFSFSAGGTTLMVIMLSYVIKKIVFLCRKFMQGGISKEICILLIFNIVLCTIVYLVNSWSFRKMGNPSELGTITRIIFFLYALLTIVITLFTMRVVRSQEKIKQEEEERKNLLEYTSQVESMYEELRAFKHDYVNILVSLSGYIEKEDMKGLAQYFEQNILPTSEKVNQGKYHLQKLSKIQEPAIKGVISSKLIYAISVGIDVFVDIVDDVTEFSVRTLDLTRILGIYLDNAAEAAIESEEKEIKFNIVQDLHSVTIVLMNSFVNHGLSMGDMEKQYVSTKGEGRGLGLNNVNDILRRYSNISKMTEIRDEYFVQTLIIENKKG